MYVGVGSVGERVDDNRVIDATRRLHVHWGIEKHIIKISTGHISFDACTFYITCLYIS